MPTKEQLLNEYLLAAMDSGKVRMKSPKAGRGGEALMTAAENFLPFVSAAKSALEGDYRNAMIQAGLDVAMPHAVQGAAALGGKALAPLLAGIMSTKPERALPLRLARATPKTPEELAAHAERVGRQMLGEHVRSGRPKETTNLAGRSLRESERVKQLEYELSPIKDVPESQVHQSRIGDINVAFPGDYTLSDVVLKTLGGRPVGSVQRVVRVMVSARWMKTFPSFGRLARGRPNWLRTRLLMLPICLSLSG
jgi:hypothetical protein